MKELRESKKRLARLYRQFDTLAEMKAGVDAQLDALTVQIETERTHLASLEAETRIGEIVPIRMTIE